MIIIITDTNVFIDLIKAGALEYFFQLPYDIRTTDLVLEEIKLPEQQADLEKFKANGRLAVLELDADEIRAALEIRTQTALKRITDLSVLFKALSLQCHVLSGDKDLRKECERHGVTVHGSIWVIREIWRMKQADEKELLKMVDELALNSRLPGQELEKLRREIAGDNA